jgi:hypothetical protein
MADIFDTLELPKAPAGKAPAAPSGGGDIFDQVGSGTTPKQGLIQRAVSYGLDLAGDLKSAGKRVLPELVTGALATGESINLFLQDLWSEGFSDLNAKNREMTLKLRDDWHAGKLTEEQFRQRFAEIPKLQQTPGVKRSLARLQDLDLVREQIHEELPTKTTPGRWVAGATSSIAHMAPGYAVGAAMGAPTIAASFAGLREAFDSYGDARARGRETDDAVMAAVEKGTAEGLFEQVPTDTLFQLFKTKGKKEFVRKFGELFISEQLTEIPTTLAQDAADIFFSGKPKTEASKDVSKYFSNQPVEVDGRVYQMGPNVVETMGTTAVQTGLMGGAKAAINRATRPPKGNGEEGSPPPGPQPITDESHLLPAPGSTGNGKSEKVIDWKSGTVENRLAPGVVPIIPPESQNPARYNLYGAIDDVQAPLPAPDPTRASNLGVIAERGLMAATSAPVLTPEVVQEVPNTARVVSEAGGVEAMAEPVPIEALTAQRDKIAGNVLRQDGTPKKTASAQALARLFALQEQIATLTPDTTPEAPATMEAQLQALVEGRKPAMLVTPGETMPETPAGFRTAQVPEGTLIFSQDNTLNLARAGQLGRALGYGIADKPAGSETVVTARDEKGTVIQDVVTDGSQEVLDAAQDVAGEEGTVEVRPAEAAIAEREAGQVDHFVDGNKMVEEDHVAAPGKMVEEDIFDQIDTADLPSVETVTPSSAETPQAGAALAPERRAFVEKKVRELGSIEAVQAQYAEDAPVDRYAREFAKKEFGEKEAPQPAAAKGALPPQKKASRNRGGRTVTPDQQAKIAEVTDLYRAAVNNPDLVGKRRADTIANLRQLTQFWQANDPAKVETGYENGDQVAYTGETDQYGHRKYVYLEGHRAGSEGYAATKEQRAADVERTQQEWREQQEGFKRVRETEAGRVATQPQAPPGANQEAVSDKGTVKDSLSVQQKEQARAGQPEAPTFKTKGDEAAKVGDIVQMASTRLVRILAIHRNQPDGTNRVVFETSHILKDGTWQEDAGRKTDQRMEFGEFRRFTGLDVEADSAPQVNPDNKEYGADNKVFTADRAEKAREILRKKLNQLNTGIDPEMIAAGIDLAGYHVEAGARTFAAYSKAMLDDLGEAIQPYLKSFYLAVRNYPGFDNAGMETEAAIEARAQEVKKPAQPDEAAEGMILLEARNLLIDLRTQAEDQGSTVDDRLLKKIGEAEKLVKDLESEGAAKKTPAKAPSSLVAEEVKRRLLAKQPITWQELFALADDAYGGTQAEGRYAVKDAYDALELGINRALADTLTLDPRTGDAKHAQANVDALKAMLGLVPTQTKRTAEQDEFQQFSTPPTYAYVANWVANLRKGEMVLEPSAGVGGLAVFAQKAGAKVVVNELSPRRADLLRQLGFADVHTENAEHLHAILGQTVQPDVVIMNPPFSATAGRVQGQRKTAIGAQHVEEALKMLKPGGRLVAIVGQGMAHDAPSFKAWWDRIGKQYHVRVNIGIDGEGYRKYGTTFDNQLLVIDKTAPNDNILVGKVRDIAEVPALLEGIRDDRPQTSEPAAAATQPAVEPDGRQAAQRSEADAGPGIAARVPADAVGTERGDRLSDPAANGTDAGSDSNAGLRAQPQRGDGVSDPGRSGRDNADGGTPAGKRTPRRGARTDRNAGSENEGRSESALSEVKVEAKTAEKAGGALTDSVYEPYRPQRLVIPGAKDHPGKLVQSAAMASVDPPAPSYTPNLPKDVIEKGKLSVAQLEAVVYAGQAHSQTLPDGSRRGFFIGDGCVDAETRIYNPVNGSHTAIKELAEEGKPHVVLSLTKDGLVPKMAHAPFLKGIENLYLVVLDDGRKVTVTDNHKFLTPSGWMRICDGLAVGHFLACVEGHPVNSLGYGQSVHLEDAPHWLNRPQDCLDHYCHAPRRDGGQPRSSQDIDRVSPPSPVCAHEHNRDSLQTGGQALLPECSHQRPLSGLHSRNNFSPVEPRDPSSTGLQAAEGHARLLPETLPALSQSHVETALPLRSDEGVCDHRVEPASDLTHCGSVSEHHSSLKGKKQSEALRCIASQSQRLTIPPDTGPQQDPHPLPEYSGASFSWPSLPISDDNILYSRWHRITLISFVKKAPFYDMYVPGPENYVAEGIVHHNTGVGKGREIAGIILDNYRQGRKKAVWVSETGKLINDAQRDGEGVGLPKGLIFDLSKHKLGTELTSDKGVLFTTYSTLGSNMEVDRGGGIQAKQGKASRLSQLVQWLGADFDGVIVFDEAHNMQNSTTQKGKRGIKKPSARGLAGVELQRLLPKARIVYVSATGATSVENLGFAARLGLWGEGTPFGNREQFISEINAAGLAAMELVARDLKAMGGYIARSLDYAEVTYGRLEHKLDRHQREVYNTLARSWQTVLQNIHQALTATGAESNANAKSSAMSKFWGAHQRFFNQVITSMQMPAVIRSIHQDLQDGKAVVLQLVNTNEAVMNRQIAKAEDAADLEDLDMTPREALMQYVERAFPTQQYEDYMDEEGNIRSRPVFDSRGNPVENPEATALREKLLDELGAIKVPDGPLEMLLNEFGPGKVAEVTGRTRRLVRDEDGKVKVETWSPSKASADADAFMADKKPILVFSEAGGTGRSYHADLTKKNQRPRSHYLIQPGWRADKAVQGFGRTHRTNQASAPHYALVTTDLQGQRRFISSIARKLSQLGALTKGQRETGSQGMFSEKDNLESLYASDALQRLFVDMHNGKAEGLVFGDILNKMGYATVDADGTVSTRLLDDNGNLNTGSLPEIPNFLNRILSLEIDDQNRVFEAFSERLEQNIEAANANGTLETGMENYRADKVAFKSEQTVYVQPESGAETKYVELEASHKITFVPFEQAQKEKGHLGFYRNKRSGQLWAVREYGSKTFSDGRVANQYRLQGPAQHQGQVLTEDKFQPEAPRYREWNWEKIEAEQARSEWDTALQTADPYRQEPLHLITGAILPIWDRLPQGAMKVVRVQTDDGQRYLGRLLDSRHVNATLQNLGATPNAVDLTPQQALDKVLKQQSVLSLANGWRIQRSLVSGEPRIEIKANNLYNFRAELERAGVFTERINYATRFFIPADGGKALGKVLESRPIVEVISATREGETQYSRGAVLAEAENGAAGVTLSAVQAKLKDPLAKLPGVLGRVKMLQAETELPADLRRIILEDDMSGAFEGVYWRGQIYLVADNLDSAERAQWVLLHEARHHGLGVLLGDQKKPILAHAAAVFPKEVHQYLAQFGLENTPENRLMAAEEVLVDMVRQNMSHRFLDKVVSTVRAWIREVFPDLAISAAELRNLIAGVDRYLATGEEGTRFIGALAPAYAREQDPAFSRRAALQAKADAMPEGPEKTALLAKLAKMPTEGAAPKQPAAATTPNPAPAAPEATAKPKAGATTKAQIGNRRLDYLIQKFQDKIIPLKRTQQALEAKGWQKREDSDGYLAEERSHGIAKDRLDRFEAEQVEPLMEAIKKAPVSMEDLELYVYARHARERNAYIQKINPDFQDGGSGMTDQDADAIIEDFRKAGKLQVLHNLAQRVWALGEMQRQIIRDAGLETPEKVAAWENFKFYVPLKGVPDGMEEGHGRSVGRGFAVTRSGTKAALGRHSEAENILAHLVAQVADTIVRAERAKVGQAFLQMVEENPDPTLWTVRTRDNLPSRKVLAKNPAFTALQNKIERRQEVLEKATDGAEIARLQEEIDGLHMALEATEARQVTEVDDFEWIRRDDVLPVTRDGQVYYVQIQNQDLARAMKNLGGVQQGKVWRALARVNRVLAMINTAMSAEFMVTNFLRDIQTAMINLSGEQSAALAAKVARGVPKAMAGIRKAVRSGKHDSDMAQWYARFKAAGGQVGYLDLQSIEQTQKRIQKLVRGQDGKLATVLKFTRSIGTFIGDYNTVVENAVRLSAFKVAVESGMSEARAASLAKNLTVNFNRKGELGPAMNALYLFYNAGIQGSARIVGALKHKKVRRICAAITMTAFALAEMNRLAAGDDDDDENRWDKVSDYTKHTNLVFMRGDGSGDSWKIKLPYGFNIFVALGYIMSDVRAHIASNGRHGKSPAQGAVSFLEAALNAFNPLGGDESLLQFVSPTILDPFVQLETNKNFMGTPIRPEQPSFGPPKPDSQLYWNSVRPVSKAIAEQLNALTGGSKVEPGLVDISPETLDHLWDFATGGAGRFYADSVGAMAAMAKGETPPVRRIPFARQVYQEKSEVHDRQKLRENMNAVQAHYRLFKEYAETGQREAALEYREKHPQLALYPVVGKLQRRLSALRQAKEMMEEMDKDLYKDRIDSIDQEMQRLTSLFNRRYKEIVVEGF